jgi:anaerobic magnesium-protoporphyrin IX monomethyl ester cyclase
LLERNAKHMDKAILLIMPDEREVYRETSVKLGAFHLPSLALAILGAIAKKHGMHPVVLDLTLHDNSALVLERTVRRERPAYVGVTCTSATYHQAISIATMIKSIAPDTAILIGGPHVSSLIVETLQHRCFDYVFVGEAEKSFAQFLSGAPIEDIPGIAFRTKEERIVRTPKAPFLRNLDDYPFPDYGLYDLSQYPISTLHARRNPVAWIETSRGCPFDCQICNKVVHGQTFRSKSVQRVLIEIEHLLGLGIREFHIADDGFTTDTSRAEKICDGILEHRLDFTWSCVNGIRVDRVNQNLLRKMRQAGCYRISFGIESGNQSVLDNLGKKVTLAQISKAVFLAKEEGFEVFGFFIFGFEDDTQGSMMDTIRFAKRLPLDLAKASIMMPFPGSPLFDKYNAQGLIYPRGDYRHFNAYTSPTLVYKHPRLAWDVVEKYQRKFYRSFYLNPRYLGRRLISAWRSGTIRSDLRLALRMKWFGGRSK